MNAQFVLDICQGGVICLTPLAAYLLWLIILTRRSRATIIGGSWDFAALLIGLSGFLFTFGGSLLMLVQGIVRFLTRANGLENGNFEEVRRNVEQERWMWFVAVIVYLGLIIGVAVRTFIVRRRMLIVYHVDPALFEVALTEVLDHVALKVERKGNTWYDKGPLLVLEPFLGGRTVTLRWLSNDVNLCQEIERHLREAVPSIIPQENPAARWFRTSLVGCLSMLICFLFLLIYGMILRR